MYISSDVLDISNILTADNGIYNTEKVRFDKDGNADWLSLYNAFYGTALNEFPENMPDTVTDYSYTFGDCMSLTEIPEDFQLSDKVVESYNMFENTGLTKLPSHFFDNATSLVNINYMFSGAEYLQGFITLPDNIEEMEESFDRTGDSASLPDDDQRPSTLVVFYNRFNSVITNYIENRNPSSLTWICKDTKLLDNTMFQLVDDENDGPYNHKYLKYIGTDEDVDLIKYGDTVSGELYWKNGDALINVESTFKMFMGNDHVENVFLPASDREETIIATNTFLGTTSKKRLILKCKTFYGEDYISNRVFEDAADAHAYLYIDKAAVEAGATKIHRNIYISSECESLDDLCMDSNNIDLRVCFDKKGNANWTSMQYTFSNSHLYEMPENMPDTVTDYTSTFDYATFTKDNIENFQLSNKAVVAKGMFRATNIVSIPSNLFDKAKKLENTANMFSLCSSLADVSIGLPNSVTVMTDMFLDTRALRGTIVLSDGITDDMERCFSWAGVDASNYQGYNTPLLVFHNPSNQMISSYKDSYYDDKITWIDYSNMAKYLTDSMFEKVKDPNGPYSGHYLRYIGSEQTIDFADYVNDDGILYWRSGESIIPVNSTYKMFEGDNHVEDIILNEYFTRDIINTNIFEGTTSKKRLTFRDVSENISDMTFDGAADARAYVYVDNANVQQVGSSGHKNIYISSHFDNLNDFSYSLLQNREIDYARFDKKGNVNWTEMNNTFEGCQLKEFPENMPDNTTSYITTFGHSTIPEIPESFRLSDKVTTTQDMFESIENLNKISSHLFDDASSLTDISGMFSSTNVKTQFNIKLPDSITNMDAFFAYASTLCGRLYLPNNSVFTLRDSFYLSASDSEIPVETPAALHIYYNSSHSQIKDYVNSGNFESDKVMWFDTNNILDKTMFEKVTDSAGPYNGSYLRYIGTQETVDLSRYMVVKRSPTYGNVEHLYWHGDNDIIEVTSTYKMFEGVNNAEDIILPVHFNPFYEEWMRYGPKYTVNENIFAGTTTRKRLVYKTMLEVNHKYDKDINFTDATDARTYVYVNDDNKLDINFAHPQGYLYISSETTDLTDISGSIIRFAKEGNKNWTSLSLIKDNLLEVPENMPDTLTDLNYAFSDSKIQKIPNDFKISNNVTTAVGMFENTAIDEIPQGFLDNASSLVDIESIFRNTQITSIPDGFFDHTKRLVNAPHAFNGCTQLQNVNIKLPDSIKNVEAMFENCENLTGEITLGDYINNMMWSFDYAATNVDNPRLKVYYNGSNEEIANYVQYFYDNSPESRIDWISKSLDETMFVKVSDPNGPYNGAYLKYIGTEETVDLSAYADMNGKIMWQGKNESIEVTSTYKMFSGENNTEDVILPKSFSSSSTSGYKVESNIFENTTTKKRLIFKQELGDYRDDYKMTFTGASDARAYLYVNDENIGELLTDPNFTTANFYISQEVSNLTSNTLGGSYIRFAKNGNALDWRMPISFLAPDLKAFPENLPDTISNFDNLFKSSQFTNVPNDYQLSNRVESAVSMFEMSMVEQIPSNLFANAKKLTNIDYMFEYAALKKVTLTLPNSITSMNYTFDFCEYMSGIISLPDNLESITDCFRDAGHNGDNVEGYTTPLVVYYNPSNQVITDYIASNPSSGVITWIPKTANSTYAVTPLVKPKQENVIVEPKVIEKSISVKVHVNEVIVPNTVPSTGTVPSQGTSQTLGKKEEGQSSQ